jgi:hypothetical protein
MTLVNNSKTIYNRMLFGVLYFEIGMTALLCLFVFYYKSFYVQTISSVIFIALVCSTIVYFIGNKIIAFLSHPAKFYLSFYFVFYILGLLPISSFRDYLDIPFWLFLMSVGMASFLFGWHFPLWKRNSGRSIKLYNESLSKVPVFFVLFISTAAAVFITASQGLTAINPDLRFATSPKFAYLVEACIPATIILMVFKVTQNRRPIDKTVVCLVLYSSVLLLSVGYQNQLFILFLGAVLTIVFANKKREFIAWGRLKIRVIMACVCISGIVIFTGMFVMKLEMSKRLLDLEQSVAYYNIKYADKILPVLPLHRAARDGMGVTQKALQKTTQIEEYCHKWPLILLDMATVLPGKQITSGQVLGIIVNDEKVSLTPGALGGLYLSWGLTGIIIFYFIIGVLLSYLWSNYILHNSPWHLIYCVLITIYLVQFTYRGLFKPMYLLVLIIVGGIWVCSHVNNFKATK